MCDSPGGGAGLHVIIPQDDANIAVVQADVDVVAFV